MLKKASVEDLKSGAISRDQSYIVITMCHYPRGMRKELSDEYVKALAPDAGLLKDFLAAKKKHAGNHNAAFAAVRYEQRFTLDAGALAELRRLAEISQDRDVTFVCQCAPDQRCHRELLLILARRWYGAQTELRKFSYPLFERRVGDREGELAPVEAAAANS